MRAQRASNERYNETRSRRARARFGAHRAAHRFDHGARDVQTDADAALVVHALVHFLTLSERLEDARRVGRKADALVVDGGYSIR